MNQRTKNTAQRRRKLLPAARLHESNRYSGYLAALCMLIDVRPRFRRVWRSH